MTEKSMIIIGSGLAGLATGCFGQMNGYETQIFEKQGKSGGVCVSWNRKGYKFDYALHNLFGVTPDSSSNRVWRELGALNGLKIYKFKEFSQIESTEGKKFTVYTDLDELEKHMTELSPNDQKKISEFVKACRRCTAYDIFGAMSGGLAARIKLLPVIGLLSKYGKTTIEDFAKDLTDPFLQKAFPSIQYDLPNIPLIIPMIFLAEMSKGDGGWPIGGSLALSKNIEKRYLKLGGQIFYHAKVTKILVENNKAIGIQLEDGTQHLAERVISAADGYSTIFSMLQGKYVNDLISNYYESYPKTQPFAFEVWYGVNRDLTGEPHALVLFQDKPFVFEGRELNKLDVEIFNFDPTLTPHGKTIIKVVIESNYDYWQKLSQDPEAYKQEKTKTAEAIAERLEKRFPGLKSQIEAKDVVTPISVEHYTDAYRGSLPWPAPQELAKEVAKNGISKTLPGLKQFHMVGQWAGALYSTTQVCQMARELIQQICKEDHKKFTTTTLG
jgi:phytoene dehydrogenase-like protein